MVSNGVCQGLEFPEKLLYEDAVLRLLYAKASRIVISDEIKFILDYLV